MSPAARRVRARPRRPHGGIGTAFALACLLGADRPAFAQSAPPPASTIVVEQHSAAGQRLRQAVLTCPGDHCEHVVRLDAAGASFGMAMRIALEDDGAWFTLRGCEPGGAEADCGSYGTGAVDALLVPLDRDGYGRRAFVISRTPPPVAGNPPGVDPLVLRREAGGPRFRLLIEVARRPD